MWLCSQIGAPIDTPWVAFVQVLLGPGVALSEVESAIQNIIRAELADVHAFTARLVQGEVPVW